jgi:hypothetical protein
MVFETYVLGKNLFWIFNSIFQKEFKLLKYNFEILKKYFR